MNWTLKYRPNQIKNLHLTETRQQLLQFLKSGYIPQVLLFAGPKGTGKTSSSRLVAAVLNEPKNAQAVKSVYYQKERPKKPLTEPDLKKPLTQKILNGQSYVVHEIDAASHRGIDDIRELKNRAFTPPVEGLMSVFILDEVHMLTTPAFNALLKLLEEPPEHAIFILATTEPEKIPATVVSRCQVLQFRKASKTEMLQALNQVVQAEKLKVDEKSLELIAQLADGSFRDAIKYLEMAVVDGKVSDKTTQNLVGLSLEKEAHQFLHLILNKNEAGVVDFFQQLRDVNAHEKLFHQAFVKLLYQNLLANIKQDQKPEINVTIALYLLNQFNQPNLTQTMMPFLGLELKALEIIKKSQNKPTKTLPPKQPSAKQKDKTIKKATSHSGQKQKLTKPKATQPKQALTATKLGDGQVLMSRWDQFLAQVEKRNSTIAALLRSAKPTEAKKGKITVEVYYRFHQEQLTNPKIINLIQDVLNHLSLGLIQFDFILKAPSVSGQIINQKLAPAKVAVSHKEETDLKTLASKVLM